MAYRYVEVRRAGGWESTAPELQVMLKRVHGQVPEVIVVP